VPRPTDARRCCPGARETETLVRVVDRGARAPEPTRPLDPPVRVWLKLCQTTTRWSRVAGAVPERKRHLYCYDETMTRIPTLAQLVSGLVLVHALSACGGSVTSTDSGSGSCVVGDQVYADGASFPAKDGCNTCSCQHGAVACSHAVCGVVCHQGSKTYQPGDSFPASDGCNICSCQAGGSIACSLTLCGGGGICHQGNQTYQPGDSFPAADGCNTCSCQQAGEIACTQVACAETCGQLDAQYDAAFASAKTCNPGQPNQCTQLVVAGHPCSAPTFFNRDQAEALATLSSVQDQLGQRQCDGPPPPCLAPIAPTAGYCSSAGSCEDDRTPPVQPVSCLVGGVYYASGAMGIPDPASCNTCMCDNGQLRCTEKDCPNDCPAGTAFGSQCAQCGPADGCQIVEFGCLPQCTSTCANGLCSGGICRQVCG